MIDLRDKHPKILVIGDLIIDHYLWGACDRISPEAPVQVINVGRESTLLGGAGNVVNNLKSLGSEVDVISVIGECEASDEIKQLLSSINVSTKYLVTEKDRVTSKKSRIISAQQQVVRFDRENDNDINAQSENTILQNYKKICKEYDLVLLSDYGKGTLTFKLTRSIITIANSNGMKVLVDPKGLNYEKYKDAYLLTPNKKEASDATKIKIEDHKSLLRSIQNLKDQCNLEASLITLSDEGIAVYDESLRIQPTVAREVFDVTGAGDTVLASLGFALSCGKTIDESVKFANLASGVVVGKIGAATASINEIIEYESSLNKSSSKEHIKSWDEIYFIVNEKRNNGQKIVFTNGCFDILHIGHIKYLEEAKKFGDILIVGLNSDKSVKNLKGKNRPINKEDSRSYILASIEVVDYVVIFDQDTPLDLIQLIKPDILVKGGDYEGIRVVGQDVAKELKIVKLIEGHGTSKIVQRIKES